MTQAQIMKPSPPSLAYRAQTILQARPRLAAGAAAVGALALSALVNRQLARNAERDNPPAGQFLEVNGAQLHYVERGSGPPLVLLHGNGSMIEDFESSGLIDLAAENYRVIVFDRPGFGHSNRPRNVVWTPAAQAELINSALQQLGVSQAIVLGHSWAPPLQWRLRSNIQRWLKASFSPQVIITRPRVQTWLLYPPLRCPWWAVS